MKVLLLVLQIFTYQVVTLLTSTLFTRRRLENVANLCGFLLNRRVLHVLKSLIQASILFSMRHEAGTFLLCGDLTWHLMQ